MSENDRAAWGVHNEMNTGVIFLRNTPGTDALLHAWLVRMRQVRRMFMICNICKNVCWNVCDVVST